MRFRTIPIPTLLAVFALALAVGEAFPGAPEKPGPFQDNVVRIRELFESRKFTEATDLLEKYQASCEKEIRWENAVASAFQVFTVPIPAYKVLMDEWVKTLPGSWVPLLARASYCNALGWKARGFAWAKDTSDEQVKRMEESLFMAAKDAEAALRINNRLVYAYIILMQVNLSSGNQEIGSFLLQKALKDCPDSYLIRRQHMFLLSPRWGGSHDSMMLFALESAAVAEKNPDIKLLPGLVYWDMGSMADIERKTELAINYYNKALTFGESYMVLEYLARAYVDSRMPDKALEVVDRAIELRPEMPGAYGIRSKIFFSLEKWDEALADLEKMKLFGGKDSDGFVETRRWEGNKIVSQGHNLFKLKNLTQAIEKYNLALRFDPESAEAYCWRGIALHRTGVDGAEEDLRKAVSIDPRLFTAYKGLDDVLLVKRRFDEIIELWTRYIALEPKVASAYIERSGTYYHKKDLVSSYRDVKRACELGNKDACARMQVLKDGPLREKAPEIDAESAAGEIGSSARKAGGAPEKIRTPGGKWSFRDSRGNLITTEEFDDAWDFKDGYARVMQNGKWGFIDSKGNMAIKPQYGYCWDFSGDKAKVRLEDGSIHYIDRGGRKNME